MHNYNAHVTHQNKYSLLFDILQHVNLFYFDCIYISIFNVTLPANIWSVAQHAGGDDEVGDPPVAGRAPRQRTEYQVMCAT